MSQNSTSLLCRFWALCFLRISSRSVEIIDRQNWGGKPIPLSISRSFYSFDKNYYGFYATGETILKKFRFWLQRILAFPSLFSNFFNFIYRDLTTPMISRLKGRDECKFIQQKRGFQSPMMQCLTLHNLLPETRLVDHYQICHRRRYHLLSRKCKNILDIPREFVIFCLWTQRIIDSINHIKRKFGRRDEQFWAD